MICDTIIEYRNLPFGNFSLSHCGLLVIITTVPRNLSLAVLIIAAAIAGTPYQSDFAIAGVALVIATLAANLGGRAWRNAGFGTLSYSGPGSSIIAYLIAIVAGILIPVLGFREVEVGGQAALEKSLFFALVVAIIFLASDLDLLQNYVVMGGDGMACSQDIVNVIVGGLWLVSTASCLALAPLINFSSGEFNDDKFLVEDENSIVGYRVPYLPNFYVDPSMISKPLLCIPENFVKAIGCIMTVAVGGAIICAGLFYPVDSVACDVMNFGCEE